MKTLERSRIGVLGAGQLALMLADAGKKLGVEVICAGQPGDCAEQGAPVIAVDLADAAAVAEFAAKVDLVTIESENIDAGVLRGLNLYPNVRAIGIAQDRLLEKQFFEACGLEVAPYEPVDSLQDLERAIAKLSTPAILKTRRMGYDGKGQARLWRPEDAAEAWATVCAGDEAVGCILEGFVAFDAEVSLIAARARAGEIAFYPLTRNHHQDGILRTSIAPYDEEDAVKPLQRQAERLMRNVLEGLDYVGVLAIEFFLVGEKLVANEMAPRVHNSGHWTIEGSDTSQFENCLRVMAGMEPGSTASRPTVMLNCIGEMPAESETAEFPMLFRHDYGKEGRPGRKVGHLTFPASEVAAIEQWQQRLEGDC